MKDPEYTGELPIVTANDLSLTIFGEVRWGTAGYDKSDVDTFKMRAVQTVTALQMKIIELEGRISQLTQAPYQSYEGDYDFPEHEIVSSMQAQLDIEQRYRELKIWREQVIEDTHKEVENLMGEVMPKMDPEDVAGSLRRRNAWIEKHKQAFYAQVNDIVIVAGEILPKNSPTLAPVRKAAPTKPEEIK